MDHFIGAGIALGTLFLVWLAGRFWQWLHRPNLKIEVDKSDGFVSETPVTIPISIRDGSPPDEFLIPAHYIRVRITNVSRPFFPPETAKSCVGYLAKLTWWDNEIADFVPTSPSYHDTLCLCWSHNPGTRSMDLLPDTPHWIDVFSTQHESKWFRLCTQWESNRYSGGFDKPGYYRFTVQVSSEGCKPIQVNLYLHWRMNWSDFEVMDEAAWQAHKRNLQTQVTTSVKQPA